MLGRRGQSNGRKGGGGGSRNVPGKHLALDTVLRTRGKCFSNWCFDKYLNFYNPSTCLDNEFILYA